LIYIVVLADIDQISQIVIDKDYHGAQAESTIKNLLLELLREVHPQITAGYIRFENVKGNPADIHAKLVYDGNDPPTG